MQMLQLVLLQRPTGLPPPCFNFLGLDGSKADAPSLKDNGLDLRLAGLVDGNPLRFGQAVSLPRKRGLVVLGNLGGLAPDQRRENGFGQRQIVGS